MKYKNELKKILEYYEKKVPKRKEELRRMNLNEEIAEMFEWHDVGIPGTTLYRLVELGFLEVALKSSKHTYYKAKLNLIKKVLTTNNTTKMNKNELFARIVGYEDVKKALLMFLKSDDVTGFIMYGPPASGKSLFLEDLYNYYGEDKALFMSGNELSRAGLHKAIIEQEPQAIIIDEVDKAKGNDLSPLLQPLEGGFVSRVKADSMSKAKKMKIKVFMAGNSIRNLPQELISRCKPFVLELPRYTKSQFVKICKNYIENINENLLNEIIEFVWNELDGDVRAVRNMSKVINNEEDLKFIKQLVRRYGRW